MSRSVPLWVGKSDDAKVPPRVRLRILEAHDHRCWISGREILPGELWDLDHKVALCNGGRHAEDNLAPALRDKHRKKTALDVREKKITVRKKMANYGIKKTGRKMQSRGFDKSRTRHFDGSVSVRR